MLAFVHRRLVDKIEAGSAAAAKRRFLHTEPHHDDLMLGYLPSIVRNVRDATNVHHFATLTSGFTAVTNQYMLRQIAAFCSVLWARPRSPSCTPRATSSPTTSRAGTATSGSISTASPPATPRCATKGPPGGCLRNFIATSRRNRSPAIRDRIEELEHYFDTVYPGQERRRVDPAPQRHVPRVGGRVPVGLFRLAVARTSTICVWDFTRATSSRPPRPWNATCRRSCACSIRSIPIWSRVAFDPEASGPDTHYKVLQAINEAVQRYAEKHKRPDIRLWGYRNVWYRFHPSEATIYVPVSLNMFAVMETRSRTPSSRSARPRSPVTSTTDRSAN